MASSLFNRFKRGGDDMAVTRKSQTTLWIYLYRCARVGARTFWKNASTHEFEELSRTICEKAVRHRMAKAHIDHSPIKSPNFFQTPSEKTMQCITDLIDLIISTNPELYSEITFKLSIPIQDERTVCRTYSEFTENLFKRGVSWPLIISLLAFSGSLATECTKNGRSILVRRICDWTTLFVVMRLKEWIQSHGGWDGIYDFVYKPVVPVKNSFAAEKLNQLQDLKSYISVWKPEKYAHIILIFIILISLVLYTVLRGGECSKDGSKSRFGIYLGC